MRYPVFVALLILSFALLCESEPAYDALTTGLSTKADVDAVLGQPVQAISETLYEYRAQRDAQKIYVQYGKDTKVAERIEVFLPEARSRSVVVTELKLPVQSDK